MADELDNRAPLSWEEAFALAFRRRWWILLPTFLCWAIAWGVSWFLPTTYESDATILVEKQRVPDQYVMPNVTANLQDRVQNMTQQILSRTRLKATIDRLHLSPRRKTLADLFKSPDPIDQMRDDTQIELVRTPGYPENYSAFKIRYSAGSPEVAEKVNSELTSIFVQENESRQQLLSQATTAFLQNELADARTKMEAQEAKVAAFKAKHIGNLPGQSEGNIQILAGIQTQLENQQHVLDVSKQKQIYLESLLQQYQAARVQLGSTGSTETPMEVLDRQLMELRRQREDLRIRYKGSHPDIVALNTKIETTERLKTQAEANIAAVQKIDKATGAVSLPATGELPDGASTAMMQIQSQLKANQLEIQSEERREKELEAEVVEYRSRLNLAPTVEQELTAISRGYEESKANYNSLLQKQMQSELATNLEQRQQGERFRVIDPPSLPIKPVAPNRFRISLGGLVAGLVVGAALAVFLELTNVRVRRERDLEGIVPVRILVGIPHLSTPEESHVRRMARWMEVGAATAMAMLIVVANLYTLYVG